VIAFSMAEMAARLDGELLGDNVTIGSVSSDSRTLQPGDLFVALTGPNFDGHEFAAMAAARGAGALLVRRPVKVALPCLRVADTLRALGMLAAAWRARAEAQVIAITGSNGKTTLKEMLASVLGRVGSVLATKGNLNNEIGVPLTLTRLQDEAFAVIELGANHPGEIDYLTRMTRPDVAVLNNAGRAHIEGFGSLEGVARAKAEILHGLDAKGIFVCNADDQFADFWRALARPRRILSFGIGGSADVSSREAAELVWDDVTFTSRFAVSSPAGKFDVSLRLAGRHNQRNALAAAAASIAVGADSTSISAGLAAVQPVSGRLCPVGGYRGARLIDDSYNANPDSLTAAIEVLAAAPGRQTLVLGDLAELGRESGKLHAEVGQLARTAGVDRLLTCGIDSAAASAAFGSRARHYRQQQALIDELARSIDSEDSILVKGSRAARMETVVNGLRAEVAAC
jgi:UDP-N-acetylmuramoyl-tripeptide--D-alanyl-D-alanine ligase